MIAESFDRGHRNELVAAGILPLEFSDLQTAKSLSTLIEPNRVIELSEKQRYRVMHAKEGETEVKTDDGIKFRCNVRLDNQQEVGYFQAGGLLRYAIGRKVNKA